MSDNPPRYAVLGADGAVAQFGTAQSPLDGFLARMGAVALSEADYQTLRANAWTPAPASAIPVETLRIRALARIDADAELARARWLTPGAGQAMEYAATEAEARAAALASDPLNPALYPYLVAEQQALAATGNSAALRTVAQAVLATVDAWYAAGAAIKRTRRTAKLRVETASDGAAIDTIMAGLSWPSP